MPQETAVVKQLPPGIERALYERFLRDAPKQGGTMAWYAERAEELGVTPRKVRSIIGRQREIEMRTGPDARVNSFQLVALETGITAQEALEKLHSQLSAKQTIKVHDRDGVLKTEYEVDDHRTQANAAEKILKFHGALSDKIEVEISDPLAKKTDEELEAYIRGLQDGEVIDIEPA